ncbi:MAG: hypothetical protein ABIT38_11275 [Gemmatimonadaceae bacterium]
MMIEISDDEQQILVTSVPLPDTLRSVVDSARQSGGKWLLEISVDDADTIRDLCGDRLVEVGFDERYEPNKAGLLLEGLVDKFFIG